MRWRGVAALAALLLLELLGLGLFAKGFFPYKRNLPGFASWADQPADMGRPDLGAADTGAQGPPVAAQYGRLVLMVVDALRNDFVFGDKSAMEYTRGLLRAGRARGFTAKAQAPTVTMPRIKALMTGTVPSFLDAVLNIAESDTSSSLQHHDNLLWQLRTHGGKQINMFGDETWLRLFPGMFTRTDGTSSFFVTDTVEVDNNVTRHVQPELERDDWGAIVLHYLGLDHIGHLAGPDSALMGPKQREMDGVVRTIHETIERQDKERAARGEKPTLLVLLGDHAMNEIGNHGGSSRLETSTVFVFVGQGVGATPVDGRGALEALMETEVQQSSLVPTLALLFGIPIPKNNLGLPLPALLDGYAEHERLHMLQTAAAQIYAVARANDRTARAVSQQVVARDARRLASAADCDGQGAIGSTLQCKYEAALAAHRQAAQGRMTSIQAERAYYAFMEHASEHLSRAAGNYGLGAMTAGMAAMAAAAAGLALLYQRGCTGLVRPSGRLAVGWPAAALWATYLLSLSSSSLIEEEHQFWYFWVQTLLALRLLTSSGRGGALRTLLQMATFRVVRAWNQTGQKWAGEHDIRRSLIDPQNACVLWALAAAALVPVNVWAAHRLRWHRGALWPRVSRGLLAYGSACALLYHMDRAQAWAVLGAGEPLVRAARGLAPSDPLLLARTVFATALLQVAVCCATLRSAGLAHAAEAALAGAMPVFLLLARPHSFGVFGLFFVILALFPPGGDGTRGWLRPPIALVLFGLAHASFFALGNSNSLASLDLSNAYAGVAQYDEVQVGLLVFLANWAGPLWWALAAAAVLAQEHSTVDRLAPRLAELAVAAHLWQATALLMLSAVATLLRSHLFVWSVFSPRYLYQVAWLVAFYLGSGTVGGAVWLAAAAVMV